VDPRTVEVAEALRAARSVVVASHVDPDGDAVGSALGLLLALDAAGVPARVVAAEGGACPPTYRFLPGSDRYEAPASVPSPDLFIAVDTPVPARLGDAQALARSAGTLVIVDHHPPEEPAFGDLRLVDPTVAASACLVWGLLPALGVTPDAAMATCLYTGLLTDTGRFSYGNTDAPTLRTAAAMVDAGAQPNAVYHAVYENRSAAAQALVGRTLGRLTLANDGRVAYAWVTAADFAETGATLAEAENLVDHIRAIGGVDVVFLAKDLDGTVSVSLRAKRDFDVSAVARRFGGGGHRAAAGCTFEGPLRDLLDRLLPLLPGGAR
jgi:phosphoesterase RecJ-like protein